MAVADGLTVYGITSTQEKVDYIDNIGGIGVLLPAQGGVAKISKVFENAFPNGIDYYHANVCSERMLIALTKLKVFSLTNSIISSIGRVIIGPIIGFIIIIYFDLSGFGAGVILIQSAMPSAILNYLIGSMYSPKEIVDNIASTIVVSTLMSFITVPLVVFFALKYFY